MPPGWDGIETVSRIWEIDPEILVVLCSAYSDYTWEQMVHRLGRTDRFLVLKKPFDNIEVRQLAMALSEKWRLNRSDVLTGLLNRRSLKEHLDHEWKRSVRHGHPLSCVVLDLDYFKRINDSHGHREGDNVLKLVANLVREQCRAGDFASRYGGEEFYVLLTDTNEEGATIWAERVRTTLAETTLSVAGQILRLSASLGVAQRCDDTRDPEALLDRADQAMLAAKNGGRNRTVRFTSLANPLALGEAGALADLFRGACARHGMTPPLVCLQQDMTVGQAASLFLQSSVNSAPVVDTAGKLVGELSEMDVMWAMLWTDAWTRLVSEIVQVHVVSYSEDTPMQTIFDFLCRATIQRVIIVRDGRPIGTISRRSLLRWFTNWVASHPGASSAQEPWRNGMSSDEARPRMTQTAESLVHFAARMLEELSEEEREDPVLPVMEGISKMQELMSDLLAYSGQVRQSADPVVQDCCAEGDRPVRSSQR